MTAPITPNTAPDAPTTGSGLLNMYTKLPSNPLTKYMARNHSFFSFSSFSSILPKKNSPTMLKKR